MDEQKELKWYYKPWVVIVLIFFVLGPFGLPLLYKSPRFNKAWKVALTLLAILYSWYLIAATIKILKILSTQISQLQAFL